jgi:hypothetical protein
MVSHEGFPVICNRWWLYINRISVFAGKPRAHTSGGVLHTVAVMGYDTKKGDKLMREKRNGVRKLTIK